MSTCPSCGGILGRDCFNPQECAWIIQSMQAEMSANQAVRPLEERIKTLEKIIDILVGDMNYRVLPLIEKLEQELNK